MIVNVFFSGAVIIVLQGSNEFLLSLLLDAVSRLMQSISVNCQGRCISITSGSYLCYTLDMFWPDKGADSTSCLICNLMCFSTTDDKLIL